MTVSRRNFITQSRWYLVGVLALGYVVSFVDRQSLALLVVPIERAMNLTDTQMSLLIGIAFAGVYAFVGLFMGVLVDRTSRRAIIGAGVACWSAATVACGFAGSYGALFFARMGVGIGEATLTPAAYSLIKDSFAPDERAKAYATFTSGGGVGSGLALLIGGGLLAFAASGRLAGVPLLGAMAPWQFVLATSGACLGIPLLLLVTTIREPQRARQTDDMTASPSVREAAAFIRREWRFYVPVLTTYVAATILPFAFAAWIPTLLGREWGLSRPAIGLNLGLMQLILAPAGNIFFGNVTDRLARRGRADAAPICGMIICAGLFIPAVLAAITPNLSLTWILVGWYLLLVSAFNPITLTALAFVTPGRMMGKVSALNAALAGIGGIALGPTLVAATSDYIFKPHIGVHSLGPAMSVVCGAFTVVLAVLYAILRRQMRARVAG